MYYCMCAKDGTVLSPSNLPARFAFELRTNAGFIAHTVCWFTMFGSSKCNKLRMPGTLTSVSPGRFTMI